MWTVALMCVSLLSQPPAQPVVVVKGSYAVKAGSAEARGVESFYGIVARALETAGVDFATIGDEDVAAGKLAGARVAIFAYTPRWAPGEAEAAIEFIRGGGKVFVFYTIPHQLAQALGLTDGQYMPQPEPGYFAECRLADEAPAIQGLPDNFVQNSWNIHAYRPGRADCRVLYQWYTASGKPTGLPAMLISDGGVYMSHVLTAPDISAKGRLLLALIGYYVPDVWAAAAGKAIERAGKFAAFSNFDELREIIARAKQRGVANDPDPALARAQRLRQQMERDYQAGRFAAALDAIDPFRRAAAEAYVRAIGSRDCEMRATWIHTAFGVADWGWEKSIRHLKEMGFNAILPNMLWGGVAYYNSAVLPVAESVKERGDQVAEAAKWCKRYGVELHVWKVNWNLGGGHTPEWFREQLRKEGRLQQDPQGREIGWLCPTDERNFRLERDSMLELVKNYDIAGIHFDYIRYPGMQGCYCDRCRRLFEERIGKKIEKWPQDVLRGPYKQQWLQFRRDNITRLVRSVAEKAHQIKPDIKVSAAVFGWWETTRDTIGQDWVLWIKEGWLDFVCPMDYIPDNEALRRVVTKQVQWVNGRVPLYVGLGEWRLQDAAHLAYQIQMVRELGADGFVLFHYNHPEITDVRMPLLRLGPTRLDATWPHRAPEVAWTLPPGLDGWPEHTYLAGTQLQIAARLADDAPRDAAVELCRLDGRRIRKLADLAPGEETTVTVTVRHSPTRLVAAARDASGRTVYCARGPIIWPVTHEELAEAQARNQPPKFEGKGLAVGVYVGGYGSETILEALRAVPGIEARPLYGLTADMLAPCRAVVVPQPKRTMAVTPEVLGALRGFVQSGGLLVVTHDFVGYRRFDPPVPEVCPGGIERIEDRRWKLVEPLEGSGLEPGRVYEHTFYDHITVSAAQGARVLVTDTAGQPLVVVGRYGKGVFCACGIAIGVGDGDRDVPPSDAELKLLVAVLKTYAPR